MAADERTELCHKLYVPVPQKLLRCLGVSSQAKMILLDIVSYMGKNPKAFPPIEDIALNCGTTHMTVQKFMKELEEKNILKVIRRNNNQYYLVNELKLSGYVMLSELLHEFRRRMKSSNYVSERLKNKFIKRMLAILEYEIALGELEKVRALFSQNKHAESHYVSDYRSALLVFAQVDEDGMTVDREGLQQLLCDLAQNSITSIVVLNTSRISCSDMVKVLIHRELRKHGADINSIEQPSYSINVHDPNDFLVNGMLELLDQYERLEIALKLGRGRNRKAKQGGYAGGGVAFGYTAQRGKKCLKVNETQADTVRRVFEIREKNPKWSLSQIADRLNTEGFKTAKKKSFTKVQVKRILDRKSFYSGIYIYSGIKAKGVHEAII